MDAVLGLARVSCTRLARSFLVPVRALLGTERIPCPVVRESCPPCARSFEVAEIEGRDPSLARVLAVLREQAVLRAGREQARRAGRRRPWPPRRRTQADCSDL